MDDVLVIGAGPAGLLAAWTACQAGAKVRVLATGIGTTHVSPGWLALLDTDGDLPAAFAQWVRGHPGHPYALAGWNGLVEGIAALRTVCDRAALNYVGDLTANFLLPTALGAVRQAALAPASFVAGDLRRSDEMLIAGPAGWRDFYPALCAENLARAGHAARGTTFDLPEMNAGQFDPTAPGLARLLDRADVRARVAAQIRRALGNARRVGMPAIVGLDPAAGAWRDLQERLGVPLFEIPTLPPSVPGIRLYNALKAALTKAGVSILLDMTVARALGDGRRARGVAAPGPVREMVFEAQEIILATGGLYGGGISTDYRGGMVEVVFGLPVMAPFSMAGWFDDQFLAAADHAIHHTGIAVNNRWQPLDAAGNVLLDNVRVAGRLLGGYSPLREGSTEGVWLATACGAAAAATTALASAGVDPHNE